MKNKRATDNYSQYNLFYCDVTLVAARRRPLISGGMGIVY